MKKLIAASIVVMFAVTGCNTVKGFGKDVSRTGGAVTNTAQKTENKIYGTKNWKQNLIVDSLFK